MPLVSRSKWRRWAKTILAPSARRSPARRPVRLGLTPLEDRSVPAVTGVVFEDFNANGVRDAGGTVNNAGGTGSYTTAADRGVGGVTVRAYDATGTVRGTAASQPNGAYTLNVSGSQTDPLRVEFTGLPAGFGVGPHGPDSGTAVQFVAGGTATGVGLGLVNPSHFSPDDPVLVTTQFKIGAFDGPNTNSPTLLRFNDSFGTASSSGTIGEYNTAAASTVATVGQVGSVWGLGYSPFDRSVYAAAYMKKFAGFGPDGTGAVYRVDAAGAVTTFADLNALFGAGAAGADTHAFDGTGNPVGDDGGDASWDAVGKTALGGLDVSADGSRIYVMNLADRTLYALPTGGGAAYRMVLPNPTAGMGVTGVTAGNPLGDLRPFAVQVYNGRIYVGAVNSAEATGDRNDLKAYVYEVTDTGGALAFDPAPVLQFDLDFARGNSNGGTAGDWLAWSATRQNIGGGNQIYPQPLLTGLAFDADGNLVLGFRDRDGDQSQAGGVGGRGITAGDTLRAGRSAGGWAIEANATANGVTTGGAGNNEGPGGGRYYFQQKYGPTGNPHHNTSVGGVLQLAGFPTVLSTSFDPAYGVAVGGGFNGGGVSWYDNAAGTNVKDYQIYQNGTGNFSKANGIGDLIAVATPPVEIGNRVWFDANSNGIQDAGEAGIGNVTVQLFDPAANGGLGAIVGTAVTAPDGSFYFGNDTRRASGGNGFYSAAVQPNRNHQVRIDRTQAAVATLAVTRRDSDPSANGDSRDSDAATGGTFAVIAAATGPVGAGDHTFDAGFFRPVSVGNQVWFDTNNNGAVDVGEVGAGNVRVQLFRDANGNGVIDGAETTAVATTLTNAQGFYLFTRETDVNGNASGVSLAPGKYAVGIAVSNFTTGGVLAGYFSSGTSVSGTGSNALVESAAGTGATDNDDNGTFQASGFYAGGVLSGIVDVTLTGPTGEVPGNAPATPPGTTPGLADPNPDASSNLTVDFGFYTITLGNQVWDDADNDGLLDNGETGINGLTVNLYRDGNGDGIPDGPAVASTATSGNGNYSFTGLPAGGYIVEVVPTTGYVSSTGTNGSPTGPYEGANTPGVTADGTDNDDNGSTLGGVVRTKPFTLNAGTSAPGNVTTAATGTTRNGTVDFGLFQPLSLGNRVWNDANNDGLLDNGETGVANVPVRLYTAGGTFVTSTTTDGAGHYLFTNLIAGGYYVEIDPPAGYVSSTGANGSAAGPFEGAAGQNPNLFADNDDNGTQVSPTTVRTGVITLARGTAPTTEADVGAQTDPATNANSNLTLDLGLFRPLAVGNLVWQDANNNGVRDPGEAGVPNAPVSLVDAGGNVVAATTTDANGNYLFGNLTPGTYTVRITPPAGYKSSTGTNGSATGAYEPGVAGTANEADHGTAGGGAVQSTVTLAAPGDPANPDDGTANLRQDFGLFQPLSIGDLVWNDVNNNGAVDPGEPGLAGVGVALLDAGGNVVAVTTTDTNGGYLFTDLTPGVYRVRVNTPTGFASSTGRGGSGSGPYEAAPNDNADDRDKGTVAGGFVLGGPVNLQVGTEPTGERAVGGPADPALDANGNRTQDFGFFIPSIDLAVVITVDKPVVSPGETDAFTVTVTNNGPGRGTNVRASNLLPPGVSLVSVDGVSQGAFDPATGTWDLGTLPVGGTAVLRFIGRVARPGRFTGTATVSADQTETTTANNVSSATVTTPAAASSKQEFLSSSRDAGGDGTMTTPLTLPAAIPGSTAVVATAAGPGSPPLVQVFDRGTGQLRLSFYAYDAGFRGGVEVAVGDVNGDGVADVVTGAGPGGAPHVQVFDGATGARIASFLAFESAFRGGVHLAAADVDGDGRAEIVVGAGAGGGPRVVVLRADGTEIASLFAYDPAYRGGVNVAAGDLDGDGRAELVTGTAGGGAPHVKAFDPLTAATRLSFFAYDPSFLGGVYVGVGDTDGDGKADIVTGAGAGGAAHVKGFSGQTGAEQFSRFAFDPSFRGGVNVAAADLNADGKADVIAAPANGGEAFPVTATDALTGDTLDSFAAYNPPVSGGVRLAATNKK